MANVDRPRGFRPYGELKHVGIYNAASTVYPGDAVRQEGGAASTTNFRMNVQAGANGAALVGVALNYATAGQKVRVADDPQQLFSGSLSTADIDVDGDLGFNVGLLATAGNTTFKQSRQEIKGSDIANTATLEFKLMGIVPRQDAKNQYGDAVEAIVKINNHQLSGGTGTQGV